MSTNIVFDFGAVLFDWDPLALVTGFFPERCATPQAARGLAKDIFSHADWLAFDAGRIELDEVKQRTMQRLGLHADGVHALMDHQGERLQPIPESVAELARLRTLRDQAGSSLKLYFLSNMPAPYSRVLEQRHDFIAWFDGGVFSGDVQLLKPELAIFSHMEQRYGLLPQHTWFIDDALANVHAANAQGWRGLHLPHFSRLKTLIQKKIGL